MQRRRDVVVRAVGFYNIWDLRGRRMSGCEICHIL